jgi:hypothetical protein
LRRSRYQTPSDCNGVGGILFGHVTVLTYPLDRIGGPGAFVGASVRELGRHAAKLEHVQFARSNGLNQLIEARISGPPACNFATPFAHSRIVVTDGSSENVLNS